MLHFDRLTLSEPFVEPELYQTGAKPCLLVQALSRDIAPLGNDLYR